MILILDDAEKYPDQGLAALIEKEPSVLLLCHPPTRAGLLLDLADRHGATQYLRG